MNREPKKKIAVFSATGCRACENAILDINYQVLSLAPWAEIVYWPYVLGSDESQLESLDVIDVCFFSGAIRTAEERMAAERLRKKASLLVACGACASFGGLPALIDLGAHGLPLRKATEAPAALFQALPLPEPEGHVSALEEVVPVNYLVPGCPPTQSLLWAAIQALVCGPQALARLSFAAALLPSEMAQAITDAVLPPQGGAFAGEKAVCASCSRVKEEKKIMAALQTNRNDVTPDRCLLEQGLVCMGIVTREGCGGICTSAGVPCRGCFGKLPTIEDPGAKAISAIASTFDTRDPSEVEQWVAELEDLSGTFYRYTLATQCALRHMPQEE